MGQRFTLKGWDDLFVDQYKLRFKIFRANMNISGRAKKRALDEIHQWCQDTFGDPGDPFEGSTALWIQDDNGFYFTDAAAAGLFKIRWC